MNNEEIKIGDVVWLKSGGPSMTVDSLVPDQKERQFLCVYFAKNEILNTLVLAETSLVKLGVKVEE